MRITLVSPFDPLPGTDPASRAQWGGVEQVFAQMAHGLARRGHSVSVVCSTPECSRRTVQDDVEVIRVKRSGTLWRAPLVNLAAQVPTDSDLVHVAATYPFTTASVINQAHANGMPCVLDFHFEPSPPSRTGRLAARVYRTRVPATYRLADVVLLRSREYGDSAPSLRGVPQERWRFLPNGIDAGRFHPHGATGPGDYLLFVGRLVPYKGLQVLLRALARHTVPLPLLVAGDGPQRRELESVARRLGVDAKFLGRVSDERLPDLYRGARLTVLPSVNQQEAFGITLLESMACGTPVVASALPGVRRVAEQGGRVVQPGDPEALGRTIRQVLVLDTLPRGESLARRIHSVYSWDAVVDRLLEIYGEVLEKPGFASAGVMHERPVSDPVL